MSGRPQPMNAADVAWRNEVFRKATGYDAPQTLTDLLTSPPTTEPVAPPRATEEDNKPQVVVKGLTDMSVEWVRGANGKPRAFLTATDPNTQDFKSVPITNRTAKLLQEYGMASNGG